MSGIISIGGKGILDITAEGGAVVDHAAVEGESGIFVTGEDRICVAVGINGESAVDDKSFCEVVISGDGQITVSTAVDVGCCGIFDITAVDDTHVTGFFCIGHAAEDHFTVDSQCC